MKTYSAKPGEVEQKWLIIDAEGVVLGRLAAEIATMLRGKKKPQFTPHIDCGDNVIVINADKVGMTGKKRSDKIYYRHTGYPGGIKDVTAEDILDGKNPERVVEYAVKRMMPKESPLARKQFAKLHVYAGAEHPHEAQKPQPIDFKSQNIKNAA